jgi:DNA-binding NarL/FixJ family response regulator
MRNEQRWEGWEQRPRAYLFFFAVCYLFFALCSLLIEYGGCMVSTDKLLVVSTSSAIAGSVKGWLGEIGVLNKMYSAVNNDELQDCLNNYKPQYLLIEGCFYREATPQELMRILKIFRSLRIVVFSYYEYPSKFLELFYRVGIEGYLDIRKGEETFKKDLKYALQGHLGVPPEYESIAGGYLPPDNFDLTDRDLAVLRLVMKGLESSAISKTLGITVQAVKNRRTDINQKLQVTNMIGLVKYVMRKGIIPYEEFIA